MVHKCHALWCGNINSVTENDHCYRMLSKDIETANAGAHGLRIRQGDIISTHC
jgi:hypothetical protein